jgi:hypothetical protein
MLETKILELFVKSVKVNKMTDKAQEFVNEYLPVAKQVSEKTGISPSILLAQWGLETGYGTKTVGTYNFGNIKDISGHGKEGIDSKTKSKDKYINFESPEAFGDYYAHYLSRKFPESLNTGSDINKFSAGLKFGEPQGYAEDENYGKSLLGAFNVTSKYIPEEKTNIFSGITPIANKILESGENTLFDKKSKYLPSDAVESGAYGLALGTVAGSASRVGYIENLKQKINMAIMQGRLNEANELIRLHIMGEEYQPKTTKELPQGVDRQFQGTVDGGETGRARETGFNTRTAQQAKRRMEMEAAQAKVEAPKPKDPFTSQSWKSTDTGLLIPVEESDYQQKLKAEINAAQNIEKEKAAKEALIKTQKMSQIPAWQRIFGSKITGLGLGALGGATAGHELYKAVEEGKQGDYLGSALSGLTGLGGMAAMVPNPVVAGIGGALAAGIPIARELVPRNIESMKRLANRPRGEAPTPAEIAEASSAYYGRGALPRKRTMIAGID